MNPQIPGARQVSDPVREMEQLGRKRVPARVALDEFHHVGTQNGYEVTAHIMVLTDESWRAPAGLGARIADLIKTAWEADNARG